VTEGFNPWPPADLLAARRRATPDRTATVDLDAGNALTYRELDAAVRTTAAGLDELITGEGPVGVLAGTRPAFYRVVFAAWRRGRAVVPFDPRLTAAELEDRVDRVRPAGMVCTGETETLAREVTEVPVGSLDHETETETGATDGSVQALANLGIDAGPAAGVLDPADIAVVMFTSGTTGRPKAVPLTFSNLVASAVASAFRLGVLPDDRWLVVLPAYHMGGLAPVVRSVLYGTTVLVRREFDAETALRTMADRGVTGVSLVPTMCSRLLDAGWDPAPELRFALLGGAPATRDLIDRCADHGVPVHPTYGMTETASQVATARPRESFEHPGTVGQPLAFTEVTVVDETGDPVPAGETGEVVVDGPTVTPGYLEAGREAFGPYGLHTGDVGRRDEDGRLWVLNRLDDRLITGGENVDPGEVVAALRETPTVADAAVVGLPDPEWGDRVGALVVPEGETTLDPVAVREALRDRLAGYKLPRTVAVVDTLPRTASDTVDREAVRRRLETDGTDVTDVT
jgi:O-succinylbenzoic acid--CoA ligase